MLPCSAVGGHGAAEWRSVLKPEKSDLTLVRQVLSEWISIVLLPHLYEARNDGMVGHTALVLSVRIAQTQYDFA